MRSVGRRWAAPSASASAGREKKCVVPLERDCASVIAARECFAVPVASVPLHRLVFLDETGSHIAMTRTHARAPLGERAVGRVPRNRGVVTTIIGAVAALTCLAIFEPSEAGIFQ